MSSSLPRPARTLQTLALLSLIGMAMLWGSTFFSLKIVLASVPVADMLAVRFTIAATALGIIGWKYWRMSRRTFVQGLVLGLIFGTAQLFQTFGLAETAASVSGFVTGLYVVFTPILAAWIFRDRVPGLTWVAVLLATVGLGVLSLNLSGGFPIGRGEILTLVSALLYAGHIVAAGHFSTHENAMSLTVVQTVVLAALCWVAALPGGIQVPTRAVDWVWLLYLALVCGALTIFLQIWAQAYVEPTRAAVIMATEPVWAAVFAVMFGGEHVTWRMVLGGLAIVSAMMLVIVIPHLRARSDRGI